MKKKHFVILTIVAIVALTVFSIYNKGFDIGFNDAQKHKTSK
nr:hypothetical protein [Mucilaginibacter sp. X4EP1]